MVSVGTYIAASGEVKFNATGVLLMMASHFAEALRMLFSQHLLGTLKFDLLEGLYVLSPSALIFLSIGILILEYKRFVEEKGWEIIITAPCFFLVASFMGFLVNILSLGVIKETGALSFKVMGQAKNTVVIVMSVIFSGTHVYFVQLFGYVLSLIGFFIYQFAKKAELDDKSSS